MNKKADVSQVFVYLFSIIIISFAGFLVIKFVGVFSSDVDSRTDIIFFDNIDKAYTKIATNWNSESIEKLRVTNDVNYVCFVEPSCDSSILPVSSDAIDTIIEGNDNVAVFSSSSSLIGSHKIGSFQIENDCSCFEPEQNSVELFIENDRNTVKISSMD